MNTFSRIIAKYLRRVIQETGFPFLDRLVIELNNFQELKKVFGWNFDPSLNIPNIYDFEYVEDANERRLRDAESLGCLMRNVHPKIALEIGTSTGLSTVLMAQNSPYSKIYTANIPPEEIVSGKGGKLTTIALEREKIGIEYRKRNLPNITQIYANTATWEPNIGTIDVAFIDGCHDTEFVFNDTRKIIQHMKQGGFILWHDFNPDLVAKYDWIGSVCMGIERLYRAKILRGRIFHVRDSWTGIYRIT